MGTSSSLAEFSSKLERAGGNLSRAQRDAVKAGALTMKRALMGAAQEAAGSDRRMHNVGRRGAALGVGFDLKGGEGRPTALMRARGPWGLAEYGGKDHTVKPRRAKALKLPDGRFARGAISVSGSRGKGTWKRSKAAAIPATTQAVLRPNVTAVAKAFQG